MAENSFQVPMPNSPLLLNYLCFDARFLQGSRLTTKVFILALCEFACAEGCAEKLARTSLKKVFVYVKEIQSLEFFHHLPTTN